MSYEDHYEEAAAALRPIQAQLKARGITMDIEQTGGWCMVGYVMVRESSNDDGSGMLRLGVTVEGPADHETAPVYLVCKYTAPWDDGQDMHEARYITREEAVKLIVEAHLPPVFDSANAPAEDFTCPRHVEDVPVEFVDEMVPSGLHQKVRCADGHVTGGMPVKRYRV